MDAFSEDVVWDVLEAQRRCGVVHCVEEMDWFPLELFEPSNVLGPYPCHRSVDLGVPGRANHVRSRNSLNVDAGDIRAEVLKQLMIVPCDSITFTYRTTVYQPIFIGIKYPVKDIGCSRRVG